MTPTSWRATIRVAPGSAAKARTLAAALGPESEREVPRAHSSVRCPSPLVVEVAISARDTGALRAGLNTYLGWIQLVEATHRVARTPADPSRA
jgi:tRNA threonylcarbamoyladenosine modification (KEOPS) complex  Pcc1 subunit